MMLVFFLTHFNVCLLFSCGYKLLGWTYLVCCHALKTARGCHLLLILVGYSYKQYNLVKQIYMFAL